MRRNAFTLVELLVVVAIIVALLAILMPSMGRATELARRVACLSNQHQIAIGGLGYASSNFGVYPLYRSWSTHYVSGGAESSYDTRDFLLGVVGQSPEVFYCPSHALLSADDPIAGWNAHETNPDAPRFISYSPIGMWEQSLNWILQPKHYELLPPNTEFTLTHQGNRPRKVAEATQASRLAFITDSQGSWDASLGLSFIYPGDGVWTETTNYYNKWTYPHRDGDKWAGGNTVMFDGSGGWGNFNEIVDLNVPYPYGADWIMHRNRGVYEGLIFW